MIVHAIYLECLAEERSQSSLATLSMAIRCATHAESATNPCFVLCEESPRQMPSVQYKTQNIHMEDCTIAHPECPRYNQKRAKYFMYQRAGNTDQSHGQTGSLLSEASSMWRGAMVERLLDPNLLGLPYRKVLLVRTSVSIPLVSKSSSISSHV